MDSINSVNGRARDLGVLQVDRDCAVCDQFVDQTAAVESAVDPRGVQPVAEVMTDAPMTEKNEGPFQSPHYDQCLKVAAVIQAELWRYDLNKRHLQIISVLLNTSLGWGLEWVRINKLQIFTDLTGLATSHVSATIDELCLMRIVIARKVKGEDFVEYKIEPDSDHWKCQPRQSAEKLLDTLHLIKALNRPSGD